VPACDGVQALDKIPEAVLAAGGGTAGKTPMRNVVPSKPALALHEIRIEDERYLGDVARQLGAIVEAVVHDNDLRDTTLAPGQVLRVRTTRDLVDAFVDKRERRKAARAAAEEAKRVAKLKAEADARAAKRAAKLAARRKKLGVKAPPNAAAATSTAATGPRTLSTGRHQVSVVVVPGAPWQPPPPKKP
jgi:ribosome-binding factor A